MTENFFLEKGVSVVEVVVALGVFSIISLVGYEVFIQTNQVFERKTLDHRAIWFAQEGVEVASAISQNDFEQLEEGDWGFEESASGWELSRSDNTWEDFSRTVEVSEIADDRKRVESTVTWEFRGAPQSRTLSRTLTHWHQEVSGGLEVDTSGVYLFHTLLGGIVLSASGSDVVIDEIQISWTKNNRRLNQIRSPFFAQVYLGNAQSDSVVDVSDITISADSSQEIYFFFNRNMNNTDFTIRFIFDDGSAQEVFLNNVK